MNDRDLDICCGLCRLICYAAKNFGVKTHGITLSQEQHDLVVEKIATLGLQDRLTVAFCDYCDQLGSC
jgi:cyclopropane-fatty-acyl-phospholipid synthase